jgi:cytochrome c peroxidase
MSDLRHTSNTGVPLCWILVWTLVWVSGAKGAPHHQESKDVARVLAPGYAELAFVPPPAGSYDLPVLGEAANGEVVSSDGSTYQLHDLLGDKFVVLSFIYTSCSDVNGCPLASYVLSKVQDRVLRDESLKDYVRMLSLSFDRLNDSPQQLAAYARNFRDEGFDWLFLTTPTDEALASILDNYDQFIIEDVDQAGEKVGSISHILRVYLIDQDRHIRNIYSVSFLHPDIIINDIRTVVSGVTRQGSSAKKPSVKKD